MHCSPISSVVHVVHCVFELQLAVAIAAASAVVALLVLVAVVAAIHVDLWHDGFENRTRRAAPPPRRWPDLDEASVCFVVVP